MRTLVPALLGLFWLMAGGCASLSFDDAPPAPAGLASARELYVVKCAKCHKFYHPNNYAPADWDQWMTKMADKSKLSPDEFKLLLTYLNAVRESQTVQSN